jgi:radical SAM protein with 4Fe4S-binding SPASM domain
MMIIKRDANRFHVFDVLGDMGVWELDIKGLEQYLLALERKRGASSDGVRKFPLLETSHVSNGDHLFPFAGERKWDGEEISEPELPESCFFDTRIALDDAKRLPEGIVTPPSVSLDVNSVCNYNCRWCCTDVKKDEKDLSLDLKDIEERIVRPMTRRGNLTWYLVGGEPALTPERTASIARMIGKHTSAYSGNPPFIALDSNGTAFEENAPLFKESGVNTIQFSLSSSNPEKDRYFRGCPSGVDSVEVVIGAVKAAKSVGLHCGLNMVLWKDDEKRQNLDDVRGVVSLGTGLEVDFIRITPAVYTSVSARNGMRLEKEDLRQVSRVLGKLSRHAAGNGKPKVVSMLQAGDEPDGEGTDRPMICRGGTCFIHVNHKGDVFPCAMLMPDFRIGNVSRDELEELWYGASAFAPWRKVVEVCPGCAACRDRNFCVGKCPAYAWFKFGDPSLATKPEPCRC